MPTKCCVPGCRSNYRNEPPTASFGFPKQPDLHRKWEVAIHRDNFTPSQSSRICVKHFDEQFINRYDVLKTTDGAEVKVYRDRLSLKADAYPTIFENQPKYMTKSLPAPREGTARRQKIVEQIDEQNLDLFVTENKINNFDDFKNKFSSHIPASTPWIYKINDHEIIFLIIDSLPVPKVKISFRINYDLITEIYFHSEIISNKFGSLLSNEYKCDAWSTFENLLSQLPHYEREIAKEDYTALCLSKLEKLFSNVYGSDFKDNPLFTFLNEQIALIGSTQHRYSNHFMIQAFTIFSYFPAAYRHIRDLGFIILPHPKYLGHLAASTSLNSPGLTDAHKNFFKEKVSKMSDRDRISVVMLDEIHVKTSHSFSGGKLYGATESNDNASTIQAFMISSLTSQNKDIVSLHPVKKLASDKLFELTQNVIISLHEIGFKIIALISDNNRVNRKMFEIFCKGALQCAIEHPCDPTLKLHFLFDSVHLLKSVRNNWFNLRSPFQTFQYPAPCDDGQSVEAAALMDVKDLYYSESQNVIKHAPNLTYKALYPTSFERQNVDLALALFNVKTIAALKNFSPTSRGVSEFLTAITHWWDAVNTKTLFKGQAKRLQFAVPVKSSTDDIVLELLQSFSSWLDAWNDLDPKKYTGRLTKETHFALKHTTTTLITISKFLIDELHFDYVLLGKFQTDALENRFGLYRRMSGCNYNVSVQQVLDSEKKIKVVKLLTIQSSSGPVKISKILDLGPTEDEDLTSYSAMFPFIFDEIDNQTIDDRDVEVLIYIAGYVAFSVGKRLKCQHCTMRLARDSTMEVDVNESEIGYLTLLDRGGLKWPTEFCVNICTKTFLIFNEILKSHEKAFINCDQRKVLISLSCEYLELLGGTDNDTCVCKNDLRKVVHFCVRCMTNIMLNNYVKVKMSTVASDKSKKRKLQTLDT